MLSVSSYGKQKYKLNYDGYGFESRKTEYAAGEKVTVYYDFIATDTDYTFYIEANVQAIQTHNVNDAIESLWGVTNVTAADGIVTVK